MKTEDRRQKTEGKYQTRINTGFTQIVKMGKEEEGTEEVS